jgi:hypothetical protein
LKFCPVLSFPGNPQRPRAILQNLILFFPGQTGCCVSSLGASRGHLLLAALRLRGILAFPHPRHDPLLTFPQLGSSLPAKTPGRRNPSPMILVHRRRFWPRRGQPTRPQTLPRLLQFSLRRNQRGEPRIDCPDSIPISSRCCPGSCRSPRPTAGIEPRENHGRLGSRASHPEPELRIHSFQV